MLKKQDTKVLESELIKRLEKKVKRLELENFEHEMKITEVEASKNEIIKKLSMRIKIIEADPIRNNHRQGFNSIFFELDSISFKFKCGIECGYLFI